MSLWNMKFIFLQETFHQQGIRIGEKSKLNKKKNSVKKFLEFIKNDVFFYVYGHFYVNETSKIVLCLMKVTKSCGESL